MELASGVGGAAAVAHLWSPAAYAWDPHRLTVMKTGAPSGSDEGVYPFAWTHSPSTASTALPLASFLAGHAVPLNAAQCTSRHAWHG
jgi:hypothetical protein